MHPQWRASQSRRWREEQAGSAKKGAFVPLKFALGEAFQFDWSTEYVFVDGLRRRGGLGLPFTHKSQVVSTSFSE